MESVISQDGKQKAAAGILVGIGCLIWGIVAFSLGMKDMLADSDYNTTWVIIETTVAVMLSFTFIGMGINILRCKIAINQNYVALRSAKKRPSKANNYQTLVFNVVDIQECLLENVTQYVLYLKNGDVYEIDNLENAQELVLATKAIIAAANGEITLPTAPTPEQQAAAADREERKKELIKQEKDIQDCYAQGLITSEERDAKIETVDKQIEDIHKEAEAEKEAQKAKEEEEKAKVDKVNERKNLLDKEKELTDLYADGAITKEEKDQKIKECDDKIKALDETKD
ncbi:MAG: hypothetical protein LKJ88_08260 [Bacilli bacterium]|jgi:hypothetical protein|nr:hypothetical protein [Bacilli bacterium]